MSPVISWSWRKKPFRYSVTPEDTLELARAVFLEGSPQSAVLWTLVQRFAFLYATGQFKSLRDFIRNYAQPLNPEWFPDGRRFQEYHRDLIAAGKTKEAAAELRRANARPAKAALTWEQIPVAVRHLVESVLSGNRPGSRAPGALHYWASRATPTMKPTEAKRYNASRRPELTLLDVGAGFGPGVNVFFASVESGNLSRLRFGSGSSGAIGGVVLVAILGYALYHYWG
jgi:hypothetical protein